MGTPAGCTDMSISDQRADVHPHQDLIEAVTHLQDHHWYGTEHFQKSVLVWTSATESQAVEMRSFKGSIACHEHVCMS